MGGWSGEREVSLRTGQAVAAALERMGHLVTPVDAGRDLALRLAETAPEVVFIALHGRGGEDGAVQGLLEVMGIPYTGSGILASALAMDKKHTKWLLERHGLPTPPWGTVRAPSPIPRGLPPCPVVVKPTCEGSTIGLRLVREEAALAPALAQSLAFGPEVMVEAYIPGRELTVGVVGGKSLPAVEILSPGDIYDYDSKYTPGRSTYRVPAELEAGTASLLADLASRTYGVLGCRGQARVDFRLDPQGRPWILEVNTIPGMTETSLLPKAAAAAGVGFDQLVDIILREAVSTP
jgi:D-alanine-D-alanine ligase